MPVDYRTFVGQNSETLRSLNKWFERYKKGTSSFFAVIHGEGGIGKTALVTYFAAVEKVEELEGDIFKVDGNLSDITSAIRQLAQYIDLDLRINTWTESDYPSQKILEQIPNDSILILDNIGSFDRSGYEALTASRSKMFVVITVREPIINPFGRHGNEQYGFQSLADWTTEDCNNFLRKRLLEEILNQITTDVFEQLLKTLPSKNPLFLEKLCQIMERYYLENRIRNIHELVNETVAEMDKPGSHLEQICKFPIERIRENSLAYNFLLSCSLFTPSRIPLTQCLYTSDINYNNFQEVFRAVEKWGFLYQDRANDGTLYLTMRNIYHTYLRERFQHESIEIQQGLKRRFIQTWFQFMSVNEDLHALWGMSENIISAIRMLTLSSFDSNDDRDELER